MHDLFFGTSIVSLDKYIMAIYLSLGLKFCYFHTPVKGLHITSFIIWQVLYKACSLNCGTGVLK